MYTRIALFSVLALTLSTTSIGCSRNASLGFGTLENPSPLPYLEGNRQASVVITFHFKTSAGVDSNIAQSGFVVGKNHVITSSLPLKKIKKLDKILVYAHDQKTGKLLKPSKVTSQIINHRNGLLLLKTKKTLTEWVTFPEKLSIVAGSRVHSIDFVYYDQVFPAQVHFGYISAAYKPTKELDVIFVDIPVNRWSPGCPVFDKQGNLTGMLAGNIKNPNGDGFDTRRGVIVPSARIVEFLKANKVAYRQVKRQ